MQRYSAAPVEIKMKICEDIATSTVQYRDTLRTSAPQMHIEPSMSFQTCEERMEYLEGKIGDSADKHAKARWWLEWN